MWSITWTESTVIPYPSYLRHLLTSYPSVQVGRRCQTGDTRTWQGQALQQRESEECAWLDTESYGRGGSFLWRKSVQVWRGQVMTAVREFAMNTEVLESLVLLYWYRHTQYIPFLKLAPPHSIVTIRFESIQVLEQGRTGHERDVGGLIVLQDFTS
jgi:hypothetical protein